MTENIFQECCWINHTFACLLYPKEFVPKIFFKKDNSDNFYKTCSFCRTYKAKVNAKYLSKKKEREKIKKDGVYICANCNRPRTENDCKQCNKYRRDKTFHKREGLKRVILERVFETKTCCSICKKVFLKKTDGSHGFETVDSLENINLESIETRNLEFDHLTEKEQLEIFGNFYGLKKCGVGQLDSYETQKFESKKCVLVCLHCHRIKTNMRYGPNKSKNKFKELKYKFMVQFKLDIGMCVHCKRNVDENNHFCFDLDHINPNEKLVPVATIANSAELYYTVDVLKNEIGKCQLLCRFCHKLKTIKNGEYTKNKKKIKIN